MIDQKAVRSVRPRLLLIANERGVLTAISRFLLRHRFKVFIASGGAEGLRLLREHQPFQVLIVDYRLSDMPAEQFLVQASRLYPAAGRILLAAYADSQKLLEAMHSGLVHSYLLKPWDTRELLALVREMAGDTLSGMSNGSSRSDSQGRRLQDARRRLQLLAAHIEKVRDEERRALARDIHDDLGQTLTAIHLELATMLKVADTEDLKPRLEYLKQVVEGTIGTVQRVVSAMRPQLLEELGLLAALEGLATQLKERAGVRTVFSSTVADDLVPDELAGCLYRVAQEAFTNILRHSGADKVLITLRQRNGWLQLQISDNGIGITDQQLAASDSFGLMGMSERVAQCGGSLSITARSGGGTVVEAHIPLTKHGDRYEAYTDC